MSRVQWEGSCHCRAVAYRVLLDAQPTSNRCNCSACTKARTWFVPVAVADFTLVRGEAALSTYTFGAGSIEHRFCAVCGVRRSEEHTSELQSLMRRSYDVFCSKN